MSAARPLPWTDLVEVIGTKPFEDITEAVTGARVDPVDRDAFLLLGPAGALLRQLMPADAPAQAVTEYGALLHVLYLHREAGYPVRALDRAALERALADFAPLGRPPTAPGVWYLQLPERLVWAETAPGVPHEPLDGLFALVSAARASVLAVLGFRPERGGFTTVEAASALPVTPPQPRPDGSAPFASLLPAGERAHLRSVATPDELVALALLALEAAE